MSTAKTRKLSQYDIARMVAHCAIDAAQNNEGITIIQRLHTKTRKPIVEIRSRDIAAVMAVYTEMVVNMTGDDEPLRAETTFFQNRDFTVRLTAFAQIGR